MLFLGIISWKGALRGGGLFFRWGGFNFKCGGCTMRGEFGFDSGGGGGEV